MTTLTSLKPRSNRSLFYGVATLVGFVVPNVMVAVYFSGAHASVWQYFRDWFGTLPASQIALDLTIAGLTFLVWSFWESRRLGIRLWWLVVPATMLVGFCFAVPLFLYLREQHMSATA